MAEVTEDVSPYSYLELSEAAEIMGITDLHALRRLVESGALCTVCVDDGSYRTWRAAIAAYEYEQLARGRRQERATPRVEQARARIVAEEGRPSPLPAVDWLAEERERGYADRARRRRALEEEERVYYARERQKAEERGARRLAKATDPRMRARKHIERAVAALVKAEMSPERAAYILDTLVPRYACHSRDASELDAIEFLQDAFALDLRTPIRRLWERGA